MATEKLIRSKIPENLKEKGITIVTRWASLDEYRDKLDEKLLEEVGEFLAEPSIEEMADILEVIEALKDLYGWTDKEVEDLRLKKREEKGDFSKPVILLSS